MASLGERLTSLDRRWVFLLVGLSVVLQMFFPVTFPERVTSQTQAVFDAMEAVPEGATTFTAAAESYEQYLDENPARRGWVQVVAEPDVAEEAA